MNHWLQIKVGGTNVETHGQIIQEFLIQNIPRFDVLVVQEMCIVMQIQT